ncbi:hypothetical protein DF3PA_100047 [Candidatus Defluviicoccus seviourii]|uniref:Uncharacterized protein n=1 Tax=Candidatus Defluviicoccus seviourii TaxID=2565273 RepID=A0A564WA99_9PROT|nr:hypothetical protein DF3PA_100047 [Candidatus Defluviicoccus seviourii]
MCICDLGPKLGSKKTPLVPSTGSDSGVASRALAQGAMCGSSFGAAKNEAIPVPSPAAEVYPGSTAT